MLYRPLDTRRNEIRLLTLLHDEDRIKTNDIKCTLDHASLLSPPRYFALSYCWGDPTETSDIILNGLPIKVTTNLKAALLRLKKSECKVLWIDAVCINQEDAEEKSHQILQMGAIYRKAATTIAWIGEESSTSGLAFDLIENFWQRKRELLPKSIFNKKDSTTLNTLLVARLSDEGKAVSAFLILLRQPYWRRIWIIQELALSQTVDIVCGSFQVKWLKFQNTLQLLKQLYWQQVESHNGFSHLLNIQNFRQDAIDDRPIHFLDAIGRSQSSLATEKRDKLFAILQLTYNGNAFIPVPNYRQDTDDICLDITMSAISLSRSLDVIAFLGNSKDGSSEPTWVPHWLASTSRWNSQADKRRFKYLLGKAHFREKVRPYSHYRLRDSRPDLVRSHWCATEKFLFMPQRTGNILHVKGYIIDTVGTLSLTADSRPGSSILPDNKSSFRQSPYSRSFTSEKSTWSHFIKSIHRGIHPSNLLVNFPYFDSTNSEFQEMFEPLFFLFFEIGNENPHLGPRTYLEYRCFYSLWPEKAEKLKLEFPLLYSWFTANAGISFCGKTLGEWMTGSPIGRRGNAFFPRKMDHGFAAFPEIKAQRKLADTHTYTIMQQILEWNMRFMVTGRGYLGWADAKAMAGDKIALLLGCSVPVILRERQGGGWHVVGDSIVYGLMDGEGLEGVDVEGLGDIELY
ncbi:heterokaryon incompatibility protein-domain-containing protein [Halenospora varia]|nr:heterokaryon incompatibility protein-domain-containing protein [Halenospora varia]